MSKSYATASGVFRNGVFIPHSNMARKAGSKEFPAPATVIGQTRQTKPSHEFLHGQPVDDETADKLHVGKKAPIHPGMKSRTDRGAEANGFEVLKSGADRLSADQHGASKLKR